MVEDLLFIFFVEAFHICASSRRVLHLISTLWDPCPFKYLFFSWQMTLSSSFVIDPLGISHWLSKSFSFVSVTAVLHLWHKNFFYYKHSVTFPVLLDLQCLILICCCCCCFLFNFLFLLAMSGLRPQLWIWSALKSYVDTCFS